MSQKWLVLLFAGTGLLLLLIPGMARARGWDLGVATLGLAAVGISLLVFAPVLARRLQRRDKSG